MKLKHILVCSLLTWIGGIFALLWLLQMTFTPGRGGTVDYVTLKWTLAGIIVLFLLALVAWIILLLTRSQWAERVTGWLDRLWGTSRQRLFPIQGLLLILAVFFGECTLLTYLAFPEPMRPGFIWLGLLCLQTWVIFRIAYAKEYRRRPSLRSVLSSKWSALMPIQRKVVAVMAILGLVYFAAFIPGNLQRDDTGALIIHADENILYPDVTKGMVFAPSLSGVAHTVLEAWPWQYGYPYFTVSAAVLLIPRLIFGQQFAAQMVLNIFLLRQFVNVLPMLLTLLLCVYMVTRYKSLLLSVGMFIFLATVPGIVKLNQRFWHPDALIVLLVVLAIYALQRDDLRFGRYFYSAAAFCGLAAILKLWGLFFGPVIAVYLLAGLLKKRLTVGKFFLAGSLFILAMLAAVIISSPSLMAPYIARVALRGWIPRQGFLLEGFGPDTTGEYDTGLFNWLMYFGFHYMKSYLFFFSFLALLAASFWGPRTTLARLVLGWCLVTSTFLAYFVAIKNFQYMLPLAAPLLCAPFLLPSIIQPASGREQPAWLAKPLTARIVWGLTIAMVGSQWIINLVILGLYAIRGR
jgi:hypothetical protein